MAESIHVRGADAFDYPAFARLYPELGPEFPVPGEAEWLELAPKAIVAERGGAIAGYALGTPFGKIGHVSQLVVESEHRRGGVGRILMQRLAERFAALGCDQWQLNVKQANHAARELYRRLGFEPESSCAWIALDPAAIERLPSMPCAIRALAPSDDGAVEDAFGLRSGQMAWSRSMVGTLLHEVLGGAGERIGIAVYVLANRCVVPLRLRAPGALAPLLASFPGAWGAGVRIAVEGDDALAALALDCGGKIDLRTDRLVAPLPLSRG